MMMVVLICTVSPTYLKEALCSGGLASTLIKACDKYLSLLAKYHVLTKAVTFGLLNFLGDIICQERIEEIQSLGLAPRHVASDDAFALALGKPEHPGRV
ncbi:hypothetical protein LINPERPRIM_LOCUS21443 [Linum perenne]